MKKLSDLTIENQYVKLLAYGDSGVGKTCFAAGFPGPIKFLDFDGKISSAANYHPKEVLKNIDYETYNSAEAVDDVLKFQTALHSLLKDTDTKTVVIDSITTMSMKLMNCYKTRTHIKRPDKDLPVLQDFQYLDIDMTRYVQLLLSLPMNVVVLGHVSVETDQSTGVINRVPLMAGKFAYKLPIFFDEVYVLKADKTGKRLMQTQPDGMYSLVRTQRGLPKEINMSYEDIVKNTKTKQ